MKAFKKYFVFFIMLFLIPLMVSCGKGEAEEIVIWAWNKNVNIMEDAISRYKEVNPDFVAKVESLSQNDIDTKFTTARELNEGSLMGDIVLVDSMKVRGYYNSWKAYFVNFSEYGVGTIEKNKMVESTVQIGSEGDVLFAMPFGIAPTVVFAYKPLWEQKDLDEIVANGWTWEDYKNYGLKIKAKNEEDVFMTSYNMRGDDRIYRSLVSQKGQWFMDKDLNVQVDNPTSITALGMIQEMYNLGVINHIDTGDYKSLMKNGIIAAQIQGFFLGGQLKDVAPETSGDWSILPLPRWEDEDRSDSITGGSFLYVNNTIPKSKKDLAIDFVKWMALEEENALKSLEVGGIYPSLISAFTSEYFKNTIDEFFDNQKVLLDVANFTKEAPAIYPSKFNAYNYDSYITEQENILFNNKGIVEAMNEAKIKMVTNAQK